MAAVFVDKVNLNKWVFVFIVSLKVAWNATLKSNVRFVMSLQIIICLIKTVFQSMQWTIYWHKLTHKEFFFKYNFNNKLIMILY